MWLKEYYKISSLFFFSKMYLFELSLFGIEVYACQVSLTLTTEAHTSNNKIDSFLFHNHFFFVCRWFPYDWATKCVPVVWIVFLFSCHTSSDLECIFFFKLLSVIKNVFIWFLEANKNAYAEVAHFQIIELMICL